MDIILPGKVAEVIKIDGVCYIFDDFTQDPVTHTDTDGLYETCSACEAGSSQCWLLTTCPGYDPGTERVTNDLYDAWINDKVVRYYNPNIMETVCYTVSPIDCEGALPMQEGYTLHDSCEACASSGEEISSEEGSSLDSGIECSSGECYNILLGIYTGATCATGYITDQWYAVCCEDIRNRVVGGCYTADSFGGQIAADWFADYVKILDYEAWTPARGTTCPLECREVSSAAPTPTPTPTPTPGTAYALRKCSDDSLIGYEDFASLPSTDYFWVCVSSVYVKAYTAEQAPGETPTSWTYLEQCGTAPTECADLVGWPGSDTFDGVGCGSGAIADDNWDMRWVASKSGSGSSSKAISGGGLAMSVDGGAGETYENAVNNVVVSGDFTITATISNLACPSGDSSDEFIGVLLSIGSTFHNVGYMWKYSDGQYKMVWTGSGYVYSASALPSSSSIVIERVGSTVRFYVGGTEVWSYSNSGDVSGIRLYCRRYSTGTNTITFDDIAIVDGSSDPIYIDPTGDAC